MGLPEIGIIAIAQNIPKDIISRFTNSIKQSLPAYSYEILIGSSDDPIFCKTKILNKLLRENFHRYQVIIQTDIDVLVPSALVNQTYEAVIGGKQTAYHHSLRYIDPKEIKNLVYDKYPFKEWRNLPTSFCSGCWNGMSIESWKRSLGYNEDMIAWGAEDTEFFQRSMRLGIHWIKSNAYPLVHINHPNRQPNMAAENTQKGKLYSDKTNWFTRKLVLKEDKKSPKIV